MQNALLAHAIWQQLSLDDRVRLCAIDVVNVVDSTQTWLYRQPATLRREWRLCAAIQQTAGQGRQGRLWHSLPGQVAFSWRGWIEIEPEYLGLLSLNAGLAVQSALIALGVTQLQLKWPNDIYVAGQKLAGLLITLVERRGKLCDVILGIGLNRLNLSLPDAAIALEGHLASLPNVDTIIATIIHHWLARLPATESAHGRVALRSEWLNSAIWLGQTLRIWQGDRVIEGRWLGITDRGELRVATNVGEQVFMADEVKLRPLD